MTQQLSEQDLQHPGIARFPKCATIRLSDVINLKRFWGTPQYQRVHGWLEGYHYPFGTQLYSSQNRRAAGAASQSTRLHRPPGRTTRSRPTPPVSRAHLPRRVEPRGRRPAAAFCVLRADPARREVLALMARGWGDARIGHHLGITERTVRKHLGRVYERVGVSGSAAAAAWWAGVPQR